VITTDGFPLAYEVMDGNTSDRTTLRGFLEHIEKTYGKAKRMWVMDRGVPTEEILQEMRDPAREIFYLVGTPKGKIQQYEKKWLDLPWQKVRDSVEVKLFEQDGELYVLAKSAGRKAKETAMRRKRLARLLSNGKTSEMWSPLENTHKTELLRRITPHLHSIRTNRHTAASPLNRGGSDAYNSFPKGLSEVFSVAALGIDCR
jgi:hypothetical protein